MIATAPGPDGRARCKWCLATAEMLQYHDAEWGVAVDDDLRLFEKLCLEGFQSGLSWRTILAKRENFRAAFHGFDFLRIARYGQRDVERLMKNAGIVRHRGKIEAVINNARCAREAVKEHGSLAAYFWGYEPSARQPGTAQSVLLSKDLKKAGWRFVGPTTVYAFMQAMGMVNDHARGCVTRLRVQAHRKSFKRPGL